MYDEPTTAAFYKMISADIQSFYQNQNASYLLTVFAHLLKKSESRLKQKDPQALKYLLNADIHETTLNNKFSELSDIFRKMQQECDMQDFMKDSDEILFHRFENLQRKLVSFLRGSQMDQKFYRYLP